MTTSNEHALLSFEIHIAGRRYLPSHKAVARATGGKDSRQIANELGSGLRAVRAGTPYELVARQLGHADIQMMARVYGVYAPRSDERDRWEKIAAEQDAAREAQQSKKIDKMGASVGASPQKQREPTTVSDWLVDSRGGTRTRDPGIMSAVL